MEDTKGVIRIRKSKDRQHNGQKKKNKGTKNGQQNTRQKTKDRSTRTPLNIEKIQTKQWPKEKGLTMIFKTPHRKLIIEQHELH